MRKAEKSNGRPSLHAMKVTDEPMASSPPAMVAPPPVPVPTPAPDPEVPATARRRVFTAEFKRQVLAEADAARASGEIGAVLRRHGLYASHLITWRHQRDAGELAGLAPKRRGRKAVPKNPLADENARLERELRRATARAERAEGLVAVQKKLAELLGEELPPEEELLEAERRGLPIPPPRKKR